MDYGIAVDEKTTAAVHLIGGVWSQRENVRAMCDGINRGADGVLTGRDRTDIMHVAVRWVILTLRRAAVTTSNNWRGFRAHHFTVSYAPGPHRGIL
jgi:hypothetical protein